MRWCITIAEEVIYIRTNYEKQMKEEYEDFFSGIQIQLSESPYLEKIIGECRKRILAGLKEGKRPSGPAILQVILSEHRGKCPKGQVRFVT